jgi:hypothetical protein
VGSDEQPWSRKSGQAAEDIVDLIGTCLQACGLQSVAQPQPCLEVGGRSRDPVNAAVCPAADERKVAEVAEQALGRNGRFRL